MGQQLSRQYHIANGETGVTTVPQDVAVSVRFSPEELQFMMDTFLRGNPDGFPITREQFKALLTECGKRFQHPLLMPSDGVDSVSVFLDDSIMEYLYMQFDADANGTIDFREMALGLSGFIYNDYDAQAELIFNVMDLNHDGSLDRQEVLRSLEKRCASFEKLMGAIFRKLEAQLGRELSEGTKAQVRAEHRARMAQEAEAKVDEIFRLADLNQDGRISLDEFKTYHAQTQREFQERLCGQYDATADTVENAMRKLE
eukprot:gnl/Trimastix_PCT/2705.p1 GENE.gnl/Trimastix_PCT/2705~~gnl/Trimastix_PCT/2705.p1  ORF type:complete len:275 (-),score=82.91 gnl/Trimastix_PCT/2705:230-1000(-)